MTKVTVPNDIFLPEVARMVADGMSVTLRGKGNSMFPFIKGGRDSVVLQKAASLRKGDIVLAKTTDERFVLHRIIGIEEDHITLMGDGNLIGTEQSTKKDVLAKAVKIIRNGCYIDIDDIKEQRKAVLWYKLRPMRRWLLAIYRRVA